VLELGILREPVFLLAPELALGYHHELVQVLDLVILELVF
jgi:hypothetical protein